ncbi:MAG: tRNA lysidine(34) synthetase TilS, partial [Moorella sp. (in: Bacteria)]|nr:tRNA lysidine(34) synthetase TilS [Moorella sp. (in: firmicutes)]
MNDSPLDLAAPLKPFLPEKGEAVAIAVSGGPDSMALCHALSRQAADAIHALTVDHGLRPESADEARQVGSWLADWNCVRHQVLTRDQSAIPAAKIQEEARHDRYRMLAAYCGEHGINQLFTAHHQDDQAETFLFRLAKGSGLDGLGAIRSVHDYSDTLRIIRPLLAMPKSSLLEYCAAHDVPYIRDPSNENGRFARARLRRAQAVLAGEGLTAKRLATTAERLARARDALDEIAGQHYRAALVFEDPGRIELDFPALKDALEEIRLRVLIK